MKIQYLGDSRDSFKLDYLDYLTSSLGYQTLNIVPMLTHDDNSKAGETKPELFPARKQIINFCHELREQKDIQLLKKLPSVTGSPYIVELHKGETYFNATARKEYFSEISVKNRQVLFFDPDIGFEPEKSKTEKHILYSDIDTILKRTLDDTVVSVFQHFNRIAFDKYFARIKERLPSSYATAIYWNAAVMFVDICKTEEMRDRVREVNYIYSQDHPVTLLQ